MIKFRFGTISILDVHELLQYLMQANVISIKSMLGSTDIHVISPCNRTLRLQWIVKTPRFSSNKMEAFIDYTWNIFIPNHT